MSGHTASRSDYLKAGDLARLWKLSGDARDLNDGHRDLIRSLIAVPCRRGEATRMEWQHVDLEAGVWAQPGHWHQSKNRLMAPKR
jgi:integrase